MQSTHERIDETETGMTDTAAKTSVRIGSAQIWCDMSSENGFGFVDPVDTDAAVLSLRESFEEFFPLPEGIEWGVDEYVSTQKGQEPLADSISRMLIAYSAGESGGYRKGYKAAHDKFQPDELMPVNPEDQTPFMHIEQPSVRSDREGGPNDRAYEQLQERS